MMQKTRCGSCGKYRATGDVCCVKQAYNQGYLHASCAHGAPVGLPPEWEAEYNRGRAERLDELAD